MNPERWREVEKLCHLAWEQEPARRGVFLTEACAGDEEMRREIESLLGQDASGERILEPPVRKAAADLLNNVVQGVSPVSLKDNDRFTLRRRLGSGGMGVVYEAYDALTRQCVALKTLLRTEASAIYRLKKEFRSLAEIAHPNLVCLFELFIEAEAHFFTMELVEGVDFVSYSRDPIKSEISRTVSDSDIETLGLATQSLTLAPELPLCSSEPKVLSALPASSPTLISPANPERLRATLRQLAEGLCALHEAGKLHRDIKPSNILVSRTGRVVVLDFGLATELVTGQAGVTGGFFGTPAYMSPEQAIGGVLSPASDWYGVGVTLYEALTGKLPFEGSYFEINAKKQSTDPVRPSKLAEKVATDLEELCMALLQRDPAARPSGREMLSRLRANDSPVPEVSGPSKKVSFVGREEPLSKLGAAFRAAKEGSTVKVFIHGSSGMGKSTLVRKFVRQIEDCQQVLAVAGRCYESESIPYKALDGVVDSIARYLVSLPSAQAQALLPRDVASMTKMFPVLGRVDAIAGYRFPVRDLPEPFTLRRRALTSLRELLARIGDRVPLVVCIDDLHWSDSDSITLLENLLHPPDAPALLLIATFRTEQITKLPFLKSLLDEVDGENCLEIRLEGLTSEEAGCLTRSLLGRRLPVTEEFIEAVTREAQGNPFLIEQLARCAASIGGPGTHSVTLDEMLEINMRKLPEEARIILETLSIAARPIPAHVAFRASGVQENAQSLVAFLRSANFLRSSTAQALELYHDRIREGIASRLSPAETQRIHQKLAESLVATGFDDPEVLFEHHYGARQFEPAAKDAMLAATKASVALAFDRAATFFRRALELLPHNSDKVVNLKSEMAQALANAGRPAEAAAAYLDAALGAESTQALDLQRRAAEQLLVGGHVDEGLEVIRMVLGRVGLRLTSGPKAALFSLLLRRFELWIRGLHFTETPVSQIPPSQLLRIDICWAVAVGLAMVDVIRGAEFQTRYLLLALRAGEPSRIARGMAMEGGFSATIGARGTRRSARFSRLAEELSSRVGDPHATGMTILMRGISKFLLGEWRRALELCETSYEILHDQCTGVLWELTSAQVFILGSLLYLGEIHEINRRLPTILATASEHGNLYAATEIKTRMNFIWLVSDDPDAAQRNLKEALHMWSHQGFHRQHYNALLAEVQVALYTGDVNTAWERVTSRWSDLRRTMLLRIQVLRIEAHFLRARCALALAERDSSRTAHLVKEVENLARAIEGERMPWSDPFAWMLRAGVAVLRGDRGGGESLLFRAARGFERSGMALHAAVAAHRLGEVTGIGKGSALIEEAAQCMAEKGVRNSKGILRMLAPGFPDQPFR